MPVAAEYTHAHKDEDFPKAKVLPFRMYLTKMKVTD